MLQSFDFTYDFTWNLLEVRKTFPGFRPDCFSFGTWHNMVQIENSKRKPCDQTTLTCYIISIWNLWVLCVLCCTCSHLQRHKRCIFTASKVRMSPSTCWSLAIRPCFDWISQKQLHVNTPGSSEGFLTQMQQESLEWSEGSLQHVWWRSRRDSRDLVSGRVNAGPALPILSRR